MNRGDDGKNSHSISGQASSSERQEQVLMALDDARLNQLDSEQIVNLLQYLTPRVQRDQDRSFTALAERLIQTARDRNRLRNENWMLQNTNTVLVLQLAQLSQRNQELAEENTKLKSEYDIRKERANNITPIQTTRFSIFGAIDQTKQSTEKENRPNCEISNDNKSIDKNS